MRVIPVIDILNGVAVQAVRGERKEYRPLKSVLCPSSDPLDVAKAFKSLGFNELYLADLDSIIGSGSNLTMYKRIRDEFALDLMIDAGISDVEKAERVLESGASRIIIGTETLNNLDFIGQSVKLFGQNRVVVSLDLKNGRILSRSTAVKSMDVASLAETLEKNGVTKVIVLDLSRVGTGNGINVAAVEEVLKSTTLEVLAGGGVREIGDLDQLKILGLPAVLVATALHTGEITIKELKSRRFV